jgi:hypothetical protein
MKITTKYNVGDWIRLTEFPRTYGQVNAVKIVVDPAQTGIKYRVIVEDVVAGRVSAVMEMGENLVEKLPHKDIPARMKPRAKKTK